MGPLKVGRHGLESCVEVVLFDFYVVLWCSQGHNSRLCIGMDGNELKLHSNVL